MSDVIEKVREKERKTIEFLKKHGKTEVTFIDLYKNYATLKNEEHNITVCGFIEYEAFIKNKMTIIDFYYEVQDDHFTFKIKE